ncbi:MAG: prepilin-type N-terminal cleavage/methylation domain-containing protein [Candidatus Omnitrophica bacterium]|nr:prepilin-type N-terminal cleavage/methylation domain-containing protein [Candidatus Omnitrophota bacterium]
MKKIGTKNGFTLIEIIVVLIIVGILAAISLPNLFQNIEKSGSAQALTLLDSYKTPIEACCELYETHPYAGGPCSLTALNLNTGVQNGWTISISPTGTGAQTATKGAWTAWGGAPENNDLTYTLIATDAAGDTITLIRNVNGTVTCSTGSAGPYTGIC